ncbi:YfiR family protein [Candidatus Magnetomoraceae bacterium gMMP-15]
MTILKNIIISNICIIIIVCTISRAEELYAPETRIKAIFIKKIAKYIHWPQNIFSSENDAIRLCVTKKNEFGHAFKSLKKKRAKGRAIILNHCKKGEYKDCHILFINSTDKKLVNNILSSISYKNILTIGEIQGFAQMGGMINFYKKDNMIRFEINVDAAERAEIKFSSNLLKLARIIRE